jgi:hypothetical protein
MVLDAAEEQRVRDIIREELGSLQFIAACKSDE